MSGALAPLELAYRGVNRLRRALYRSGVLPARSLPRPVISIGNRAIGGAGKTPSTIALARLLQRRGLRVCVLTRGYGRMGVAPFERVDSANAQRFGDEPVVIAASLPDVPVIVGADRYAAGRWFLDSSDCDLFLLDDGMQHLQLARDCNIVVESTRARWLREGRSALADADVLLVRGEADATERLPHFRATLRPSAVRSPARRLPLSVLQETRVVAFAGLADNQQFFGSVRALGANIIATREFRDHHVYTPEDVRVLRALAEENGAQLLTTAKDAAKIDAPLLVLEVEMMFEREEELVDLVIAKCGLKR